MARDATAALICRECGCTSLWTDAGEAEEGGAKLEIGEQLDCPVCEVRIVIRGIDGTTHRIVPGRGAVKLDAWVGVGVPDIDSSLRMVETTAGPAQGPAWLIDAVIGAGLVDEEGRIIVKPPGTVEPD